MIIQKYNLGHFQVSQEKIGGIFWFRVKKHCSRRLTLSLICVEAFRWLQANEKKYCTLILCTVKCKFSCHFPLLGSSCSTGEHVEVWLVRQEEPDGRVEQGERELRKTWIGLQRFASKIFWPQRNGGRRGGSGTILTNLWTTSMHLRTL